MRASAVVQVGGLSSCPAQKLAISPWVWLKNFNSFPDFFPGRTKCTENERSPRDDLLLLCSMISFLLALGPQWDTSTRRISQQNWKALSELQAEKTLSSAAPSKPKCHRVPPLHYPASTGRNSRQMWREGEGMWSNRQHTPSLNNQRIKLVVLLPRRSETFRYPSNTRESTSLHRESTSLYHSTFGAISKPQKEA